MHLAFHWCFMMSLCLYKCMHFIRFLVCSSACTATHLATRIKQRNIRLDVLLATHGTVSAFDPSKEDWTNYEERLRYYFIANDVKDAAKKRSILLAACGAPAYKLIRSLVQADKLDSTPYDDFVEIVKKHYDPKPSVTIQRYKFNTRARTTGESVATYVAALRELAQHCEYKDALSDMLRDRLVCGVIHKGITNRAGC